MKPLKFCEVYLITILRSCSFKLYRVFLLTKCFVLGEKWLWNVLLDCFKLPGKSVFNVQKYARNVALKWLNNQVDRRNSFFNYASGKKDRQTDRQTDRHRQTDRQTDPITLAHLSRGEGLPSHTSPGATVITTFVINRTVLKNNWPRLNNDYDISASTWPY